jgi:hypothetical protein
MICPNCRYEYVLGVTTCPDCGAALVYKLQTESAHLSKEPDKSSNAVIVFESDSHPDIAIAKQILDEAEIQYITGRRANIFVDEHKETIQVGGQDAECARALLADLVESGSRLAEDVNMEEASGSTQEEEP